MIRLIILAIVLSMLSGTLGAGLAACRNWTMGPATEAGTTAAAAPDPAATRHNTPPSETDRLWAALERERAARRAAERRLERIAQPRAAHAGPERQQPPAPPAPAATAEPSRNEPIPAPSPAPATQATPTAIPAGTAITVRTAAAATSATARVEDAVSATTVSEVMIDGQTVHTRRRPHARLGHRGRARRPHERVRPDHGPVPHACIQRRRDSPGRRPR